MRKKSPFSEEEPAWVVLEHGAQKHHSGATEVPHALQTGTEIDPFPMALQRLVDRFIESNVPVHPQLGAVGWPHFQEDLAERIGDFPNRQSVSKRRNQPPAASQQVVARDSKICVIMLVSTRRRNSTHHDLSSGKLSRGVISRLTDRPWPARSRDLSFLDF